MRKAGGNWVDGDSFFDREAELGALTERVREGTHTLLTAQRRMGKTSLVRELLRRLKQGGQCETIFVDLEGAASPADAVAEIAFQSRALLGTWAQIRQLFANSLPETEISGTVLGTDLKVKLRAGVDAGNWQHKGDQVFAALAHGGRVALALDELPILVNRVAFEMLTEAAVAGRLSDDAIARQRALQASEATPVQIDEVLHVLEHDGYLARQDGGYCFTSGLLEDWWRVRYGGSAVSSAPRSAEPARSAGR